MLTLSARERRQDGLEYRPLEEHGLTAGIEPTGGSGAPHDPIELLVTLQNASPRPWSGVVRIDLPFTGHGARFFLPGFMYGRNRGEAPLRTRHEWPRLRPGATSRPAASSWMTRSDRLTHPVALAHVGGRVRGLSVTPYLVRAAARTAPWRPGVGGELVQYTGFTCSVADDDTAGTVGITLGYEHSPWLFVQALQVRERAALDENCLTLDAGESVRVPISVLDYVAPTAAGIVPAVETVYRRYHQPPRPGADVATAVRDLASALDEYAWQPDKLQYSGFVRQDARTGTLTYNEIPSTTWTNGLSVAVPVLLASLRLGEDAMRRNATRFVQRVVDESINPSSGLPFETCEDGTWSNAGWWYDDLSNGGHSGYLAGQAAYFVLKAYEFERRLAGRTHPDWLGFARQVVSALDRTRNPAGEYPYVISATTGEAIEYDSMGGAWGLAAAAYLAALTGDRSGLAELRRSEEHYFRAFVERMECYGAPLDTEKAVDSEGVIAYAKAVRYLHVLTGERAFLQRLADGLSYEFTFKYSYHSPLDVPPLSSVGWTSTGGTVTSTANPHIHPMGSYLVDEIAYLAAHGAPDLADDHLRSRLEDTVGWGLQTYNRVDGEYGYGRRGWMSERFCYSEGLLVERFPDGSPASTWFALMGWAAGCVIDGLVGDYWDLAGRR